MKYRFFYGMKPDIRTLRPGDFSGKGYVCDLLLQTRRGVPVTVFCNRELDIWKVQHGFSTVFFGTRADALAYCKGRFYDANGQAVCPMTKILYYPLIGCDTEGTAKAAMIPTPHEDTVRAQAGMWLEEMIPHYFRLCSQNSNCPADTYHIRCPRCGKALKRIGADINETRHGLYVCSACVTK